MFFKLALKSLLNRKGSVIMTLLAIGVAIFVLLGIEHIRHQARDSFASTVSGVDLIVGAKTGSLNLLLYSVFRMGAPTDNISWDAYQDIANDKNVAWAIPLSLGDSHKGYRVMGTTEAYFDHFSYGNKRALEFAEGDAFAGTFDAVLGAEVARTLSYDLGREIILAHGVASTSFTMHDNTPFTIVGILAPTGTPVDQTIHVRLAGIEAMHAGFQSGPRSPTAPRNRNPAAEREPESITAFMLGLNSRMLTFKVQREINGYKGEPLLAILPGVALAELWQMVGMFENVLRLISMLVLVAAVLGLGAVLLASVRERNHEIHLLRVLGAPPYYLFLLMEFEALLICLSGMILGTLGLYLCLILVNDALFANFGLHLDPSVFTAEGLIIMAVVLAAALLAAAIPSMRVYSQAKGYNDH
ncbi:peptide ABC transporter permease [Halioglobus sp. HI00S01]|uniref:ABC transporter permease n=1 Tax=Halioglobus sp. HI00S01 TaxID=1822214 RepID=UPI0007C338B6|nr:FtsX-like permease family protein [Halioglobus sp. HI00S01]KZX58739.1 peptide ABC transporter permease [Halioglobus sp. HI00S01]